MISKRCPTISLQVFFCSPVSYTVLNAMFGQFHDDPVSDTWLFRKLQPTLRGQLRKSSFTTQKTALQKASSARNDLWPVLLMELSV